MKKMFWLRLTLALAGVGGLLASIASLPAQAQSDTWSQPLLVFESQGEVTHPNLVADRYGQVHAFWIFVPDAVSGITGKQVYYARLDRTEVRPIDILLLNAPFASLDAVGNDKQLTLMWDSSVTTQSFISPEPSAREWAEPYSLSGTYSHMELTVAPDNSLWSGFGDLTTNAVFVRHQDPVTGIWDSPQFVSNTTNPNTAPDAVKLSIGSDGTFHAVWSEYQLPNGWPPVGVYYSRSTDNGQNWTAPVEMSGSGANQPNVKVGFGQNVYMTWVGMAGVGGKYFSQSTDGGLTWSGAVPLTDLSKGGGSEGAVNMVVDSAGTLHALFSLNNCVWYMRLEVDGWTQPDCISSGVPSSHTEEPTMILGLGNQLHVLWWANNRQLWYMSRQLSVPGQSPLPTPTKTIATPVPPTAVPTIAPTATLLPDYGAAMDPNLPSQTGTWAMLAGVVPVLLLIAVVFIRRRFK